MTAIAVTGKGGTGKTLVSALLIHFISKKSRKVLAVDADPDSNLSDALGVEVERTLGDVREIFQVSRDEMGTMNKEQWLEGKIYETICECNGFDLLVMGRPEGEGCYCFANSLLRGILRKLTRHYEFVIIDSEAGLEHFSRKTIDSAEYVIVVTDMSKKGLATASRIKQLVKELKLNFKDIMLIANRISSEEAEKRIREFSEREKMKLLEVLPYDERVVELDLKGLPVVNLDESSEVYRRMRKVAEVFLKG
ncbi:MAG: ATP-binding protein [Archaeoglobi archaeon]|jgi:CO dehydrogenase maturation factor|nr:MAG: ATP-binding protein [Archaeoglobi archaeon]TDA26252.1 MAG: ATP-binding protein [Archaeoglobi archaeon]